MTTAAESKLDFNLSKGTLYLALSGKIYGVLCEDLEENWLRYNSTALSGEI